MTRFQGSGHCTDPAQACTSSLRQRPRSHKKGEGKVRGIPSPAVRTRNVLQTLGRLRLLVLHRAERLHAAQLLAAVPALGNRRLLLDVQEREPAPEQIDQKLRGQMKMVCRASSPSKAMCCQHAHALFGLSTITRLLAPRPTNTACY
jgi:hypothetical protein